MNPAKLASALIAGLVFGAGLALSGMTNPHKVLNFLDVTRHWDPSLALVMAAAVPVSAVAFWLTKRRAHPLFEPVFVLPVSARFGASLWVGSALFGIGWGLAGYCPGPAVASLSRPNVGLIAFLVALSAGLLLSGRAARLLSRASGHG